jgi:hypothetical protein
MVIRHTSHLRGWNCWAFPWSEGFKWTELKTGRTFQPDGIRYSATEQETGPQAFEHLLLKSRCLRNNNAHKSGTKVPFAWSIIMWWAQWDLQGKPQVGLKLPLYLTSLRAFLWTNLTMFPHLSASLITWKDIHICIIAPFPLLQTKLRLFPLWPILANCSYSQVNIQI